ncbi:hypothetical protein AB0C12_27260 [Actinoplanes sp. NPDC048967]|uniref:hypothetical protein n=1 Tax=Actinoplanes sp. NPDC048967 TaxID=3155269 RepID=UPI0033FF054C
MTAATTKAVHPAGPAKKTTMQPGTSRDRTRRLGRETGNLAINAYERGVADVVAFEKDAARIAPYPWMRAALTLSAGLIEDVGAAYVKTARSALR